MEEMQARKKNRLRKEMKDVGYGGKRAGVPAAGPVDVPIMAAAAAAVKENTPTQRKFGTAANVRHRRPRRLNETKKPKPSPLPRPPHCAGPSEHSKPTFAGLRRMKDRGRSSDVLTPSNSHPRRIWYTEEKLKAVNHLRSKAEGKGRR